MHDALARFINVRQVALPLHSLCNFLNFSPILPKKLSKILTNLNLFNADLREGYRVFEIFHTKLD